MAYQVIARKWRPKTFQELVGQDHVSQTLLNALKSERLPHALLFTGPRGTGKTSSARLLAKSIRCPNAVDFVPCNKCKDCEDISAGRSFDVHELDGASNNGVDAVRELQDSVRSMPSSGRYKLYIIDEVHMLSISAFNALLKTLEEPPEHVIFILATTEVQKLPNTILSRCQRFDFRRIPIKQVSAHLKQICEADGVKFDEESLWVIARQGEGSMRDSQSLLDQVITYTNADLSQEKVVEILGLTDRTLLIDTLTALCNRSSEGILSVIERILQSGHDPKVFCDDLLEELRNLLLVKVNPDRISEIVDLPASEIENLAHLGTLMTDEDVHMLFDMTLKGAADIGKSSDTRLVLEMLLLRMASAPKVHALAELAVGATPATQTPVAQKKKPKPVAVEKPKAQNIFKADLPAEENWFHFVQKMKSADPTIAAQLDNTHVISIEGSDLHLGLPNNLQFLYDRFQDKRFTDKLSGLIEMHWHKKMSIKIDLVGQTTAMSPKEASVAKKKKEDAEVREKVEKHPLVQLAQRELKVKISRIDHLKGERS